jgi:hypothetical protein
MAELKITASDKKRIDVVAAKLTAERAKLEDAISVFNEAVNVARNALSLQIDAYNEAQEEAFNLIDDIHREQEDNLTNKSEKWQDSPKGELAREWVQEIEEIKSALEGEVYHSLVDALTIEELLGETDSDVADIATRLEEFQVKPGEVADE